jgi:dihydrofolate synthase/folylpolyglutamate synthase
MMVNLPDWPRLPIWQKEKQHDLQLMQTLLSAMENPHKNLPPTIHVAGTNGKGSTVAMLRSVFEASGYKVHTYTSPHLVEFNERINLAGKNISDYHLFELLAKVRAKAEGLNLEPSFFEGTTLAAFLAFESIPADLLILETGMGGRIDSTNVIEKPILTIITTISFDHTRHLGNSLTEIAKEKAGIIKEGVPCVIGAQSDEVYEVLIDRCNKLNSPAFCYEYDYAIEETNDGLMYRSKKHSVIIPYPLFLLGQHQYLNASSVVAAIMLINDNFKIQKEKIAAGIANTKWPGRIEMVDPKKYSHLSSENIKIYLDGAHNEGGACVLSSWIKEYIKKPVYIIIGMTNNRDIEKFCQYFQGLIIEGRAVKVLSEPSSYNPDIIAEKSKKYDINIKSSDSLDLAIKEISTLSANNEAIILITGSLFLVSDFYKLL